jgi:DNA-binding transcriptional LysR family regulator
MNLRHFEYFVARCRVRQLHQGVFLRANPDASLSWRELGLAEWDRPRISGEVDVAFLRLPLNPELLAWEHLFDEPRGFAVPEGHDLWHAQTIDRESILHLPLLPVVAPVRYVGMALVVGASM